MIKKENTQITFITSKKVKEILIDEAEYQGRTVSNLVNQIVNHYIKNKKTISLE